MDTSDLLWKATAAGAAAASAFATRKVIRGIWRATQGDDPPTNPASPSTRWVDAIAFAAASGVAIAVSRVLAQRGAAAAWKAKTGEYPGALENAA